jgi:hypothetical protein
MPAAGFAIISPMILAVSQTLLGVIVGGGITAVVSLAGIAGTFFAPNWQEERSERRQTARSIRRATRLVGHELETNGLLIAFAHGQLAEHSVVQKFEYEAWTVNREALADAEEIPDALWQRLARSYTLLNAAERALPNLARGDTDARANLLGQANEAAELAKELEHLRITR